MKKIIILIITIFIIINCKDNSGSSDGYITLKGPDGKEIRVKIRESFDDTSFNYTKFQESLFSAYKLTKEQIDIFNNYDILYSRSTSYNDVKGYFEIFDIPNDTDKYEFLPKPKLGLFIIRQKNYYQCNINYAYGIKYLKDIDETVKAYWLCFFRNNENQKFKEPYEQYIKTK